MKNSILFFLAFSLVSCASNPANEKAMKQCGVSPNPLMEPQLDKLKCMEEKGKNIPGYESVQHKIDDLEKKEQKEFEEDLSQVVITTARFRKPIGGVMVAPAGYDAKFIKERAKRFCSSKNIPEYEIIEQSSKRELKGVFGSTSFNCDKYSCGSFGSSRAKYNNYLEVKFECMDKES